MGLSSSLPPAELARQDSALFGEVKHLFSTAPEAEKRRRKSGVFLTEKQSAYVVHHQSTGNYY
jgi:hypothetical protein